MSRERCLNCGEDASNSHFDRSLCACGAMHYHCNGCGYPVEGCPDGDYLVERKGGDPGWFAVHAELLDLHEAKAADYGTSDEALANYISASEAVGEPDEFTCWLRALEKCHRALNLIRAGRADEVKEGTDVAALAIGAEALRRRRIL